MPAVIKKRFIQFLAFSGSALALLVPSAVASGPIFRPPFYADSGGPEYREIISADFNNDGSWDLALVASGAKSVSVLLGNGDGTFQAPVKTSLPGSSGPARLASGDFNLDGIPDLAVADGSSAGIGILLGNGDGTFTIGESCSTNGGFPSDLSTGDFNFDGIPDLAVVLGGAPGRVLIYLGAGNGTFLPVVDVSVQNAPAAIATGNFLGSGSAEFAVSNRGSQSISILSPLADGSFGVSGSRPVRMPFRMVAQDFNFDGYSDIAVIDTSGGAQVLINDGAGGFSPAVYYPTQTATAESGPQDVVALDFDGDGIPDLVVASYDSPGHTSKIALLRGVGDGTFGAAGYYGDVQISYSGRLTIGDFDNDGAPDIAAPTTGGKVAIFLNAGAQILPAIVVKNITADYSPDDQIVPFECRFGGAFLNWGQVTVTVKLGSTIIRQPVTTESIAGGIAYGEYILPGSSALGTYTIEADYVPYPGGEATHGTGTLTVQKASTSTAAGSRSVTFSANPQSVILSAKVTGSGVHEGSVAFIVRDNTYSIVGVPVTSGLGVDGVATAAYIVPGGTKPQILQILAEYSGSEHYLPSHDSTSTLAIEKVKQPTTISAAGTVAYFSPDNQSIELSAVLGGGPVDGGAVTFTVMSGTKVLGVPATTTSLSSANIHATFIIPGGTGASTYSIVAKYSGSENFLSSVDSTQTLTIKRKITRLLAIDAAVSFSNTGQKVPLVAYLNPETRGQGVVMFSVLDGAAIVGSLSQVPVGSDAAARLSYTLPGLTIAKDYIILVNYTGSLNVEPASAAATLTVSKARLTVTVDKRTAISSDSAQSVVLGATMGNGGSAGNMTFRVKDGESLIGNPVTTNILGGQPAVVSYSLPAGIAPKVYTIEASYFGDPNAEDAMGIGPLVVNPAGASILTINIPPGGGEYQISMSGTGFQDGYALVTSSILPNPMVFSRITYSSAGGDPVAPAGSSAKSALVTEVELQSASPLLETRMFIDSSNDKNSGIALVNARRDKPNLLRADFRDPAGNLAASTNIVLAAGEHKAIFPGQLVSSLSTPFLGTISLSGSDPFVAASLSYATNGRGEINFSSLPAPDLDRLPFAETLFFPHLADGGGYRTQLLLMNPSRSSTATGSVDILDDSGNPLSLNFGGSTGWRSTVDYSIPPNGMVKFETAGSAIPRIGYARLTRSSGTLPVGSIIFQAADNAGLVTQAGVPDSPMTTAARLLVDVASSPLSRNTGLAIVNPGSSPAPVLFKLTESNGNVSKLNLSLPPQGHLSKLVTELFSGKLPKDFHGVLEISSPVPVIPLSLRLTLNERGQIIFSTMPVADLNYSPSGPQYLPHIVNGDGYKTELVIVDTSGKGGQVFVNLFNSKGAALAAEAIPK